jgi:glycogen(starch) synthase
VKILHFIYDHIDNPWVGGGGAVRVCEIYKRLADRNDITVVSGRYPGASDYSEGNLRFRFVGTGRDNYVLSTFTYACAASSFLLKEAGKVDVVVEDFAPYNPLPSAMFVKTPTLIQVHHKEGMNLIRRYFLCGLPFVLLERYYPRLFKNAICVSEASRKKFGMRHSAVIPNGIDWVYEAGAGEGNYISYVGRIHLHNKGLDTLLNAMKEIEGSKLAIVGRGKDEDKLMRAASVPGLEDRIDFKGFLAEEAKRRYINDSAVLVLPSRYEGQGIVVLEAAACGRPVIVSDIPELRYAVDAGFGLSFRVGDEKDLAKKITFILGNEALRLEMGRKGREYAGNFTWDRIAKQYEIFLLHVVENHRKGPLKAAEYQ